MKIELNTDEELVNEIRKQLKENDGYCPCKLYHIPDNKCMCKDFRDEEEYDKYCHCGLYKKVK